MKNKNEIRRQVNLRTRNYLNVPIGYKELAKSLGAKWDPDAKRWYVPHGSDLAKVLAWQKPPAPSDKSSKH